MIKKRGFFQYLSYAFYKICITSLLLGLTVIAFVTIIAITSLPPTYKLQGKMDVYASKEKSNFTSEELPTHLANAIIAIEDRRYYSHIGVDPIAIIRAFLYNLEKDKRAQGGSTITQQLARNLFLHQKKTYTRKLQEIAIAIWLEAHYSKTEILTAYLNSIYFGQDCFGLKCASSVYFKKSPKKLHLVQSAMLAGLLRAPNYYSPYRSKRRSWQRTKRVLRMMRDLNYITNKEFKNFSRNKFKKYLP